MNIFFVSILSLLLLLLINQVSSLATTDISRRDAFVGITSAAATAFFANTVVAQPANAEGLPPGSEAFVGTFSDPINHPGGKRTIKLLDTKAGDYQLAQVIGGGGVGEPKNYVLPAAVIGDRTIVIDFSPKGGPKDFVGVLDKSNGDIKFLKDGNRWPRLNE